jgi:hypothetical protein
MCIWLARSAPPHPDRRRGHRRDRACGPRAHRAAAMPGRKPVLLPPGRGAVARPPEPRAADGDRSPRPWHRRPRCLRRMFTVHTAMLDALSRLRATRADFTSFHIGGGTYSVPRAFASHGAGAITVAEIDPAVTQMAVEFLVRSRHRHDPARGRAPRAPVPPGRPLRRDPRRRLHRCRRARPPGDAGVLPARRRPPEPRRHLS